MTFANIESAVSSVLDREVKNAVREDSSFLLDLSFWQEDAELDHLAGLEPFRSFSAMEDDE